MATQTVAGPAAGGPANNPSVLSEALTAARDKALQSASNEITAIAQTLQVARNNKGVHNFDALLPGALMRLELLGTCVGVLSDARHANAEDIGEQYWMVMGEKLEANHA